MKKILALLVVAALAFSMVAACTSEPEPVAPPPPPAETPVQEAPVVDDTPIEAAPDMEATETHLNVVQAMLPTNLDPVLANEVPMSRANYLIFQTLVYLDGGAVVPGLATSWEFTDPETLVLQIREGVKFHDGSILTAEDVVFTLNRAGEAPIVSAITGMIKEAEITGDHEVTLTTDFPFAPILLHLSHTANSIVSKAVVESIGEDEHTLHPIGTGPFKFVSQVAGDRYDLVRFDDFNSVVPGLPEGQLPSLESITFRVIPDPSVRTIELETGAAHVVLDVGATEVSRIRDTADLNMYEVPGFSLNSWLGFNMGKPPFDDHRVREAVALAIDIESIVDVAWAGLGIVGTSLIPTTVPGFKAFPIIPQDIDRARELMAEAGYADGFETDVWLNEGNAMRADAATMIQAQLRALNIETTINIYEWATLLPATQDGEHEMSIMGWTTATGDPDYGLYPLYHSDAIGGGDNRTFTDDPRVDELLERGRSETNEAERMRIYGELQEVLMEILPIVPLWQSAELHATRDNIHGFSVTPCGKQPLWNVVIG